MAYEKGKPEPGIKAKLLDDRVRGNNDFIQPAINQDHEFTDANASEQSGKHMVVTFKEQSTPGASAANEAYLTAVDSGTQPELEFTSEDGTAITLTSDGSMGSASTDVSVNDATVAGVLNVTGATGIDGNFDVNTDKFTVDSATGNTVVAGTLDAQTSLKLATGATVTEFSTDDTLAGDSDTAVPTEKSTKAYVDAIKYYGGGYDFGGNTNLTSSYATLITFTDTFSGKPVSWSLAGGWNGNTTGGQVTIRVRNSSGYSEEFVLNVDTGSGTTFRDSFGYGFGDILTSLESGTGSVTVTIEAKQSGGGGQVGVGHSAFIFQECDR